MNEKIKNTTLLINRINEYSIKKVLSDFGIDIKASPTQILDQMREMGLSGIIEHHPNQVSFFVVKKVIHKHQLTGLKIKGETIDEEKSLILNLEIDCENLIKKEA